MRIFIIILLYTHIYACEMKRKKIAWCAFICATARAGPTLRKCVYFIYIWNQWLSIRLQVFRIYIFADDVTRVYINKSIIILPNFITHTSRASSHLSIVESICACARKLSVCVVRGCFRFVSNARKRIFH